MLEPMPMHAKQLPYSLPLAKGVRILHTAESGLVALEKPDGLLSTPNTPGDLSKTLLRSKFSKKEEAYIWFDEGQVKRTFYICHRLDSPTSGILIGTLNEALALKIRQLFKTRKIQKTYIAVVRGIPRSKKGTWNDQLKTSAGERNHFVRTQIGKGGDESVASWQVIREDRQKRVSCLELKPHTGRTHQLRVQTSSHELPILGDRTYGDFKFNAFAKKEWGIQRLMLHAHRVEIHDASTGLNISIESPAPMEFSTLFDK